MAYDPDLFRAAPEKLLEAKKTEAARLGLSTEYPSDWQPEEQYQDMVSRIDTVNFAKEEEKRRKAEDTARKQRLEMVAKTVLDTRSGAITEEQGRNRLLGRGVDPQEVDNAYSGGTAPPGGSIVPPGGSIVGDVTQGALAAQGGMPAPQGQPAPTPDTAPAAPQPPQGGGGYGGGLEGQLAANQNAGALQAQQAIQDIGASTAEQQDVLNRQADLYDKKAAVQAMRAQQYNQAAQAQREESQRNVNEVQQRVGDATGKLTELQTNARNKSERDPTRLMKGWRPKVLAGLAVALGEFGRALTNGTQNLAMNTINDAIQRDLDEQEDEYNAAKDAVEQQNTFIGRLREQLGDTLKLRDAGEILLRQQYIDNLDLIDKQYAGPEKRLQLEGVRAGLTEEQNRKISEIQTNARKEAEQVIMDRHAIQRDRAALAIQRRESSGEPLPTVEGFEYTGKTTPTKKALDEFQEKRAAAQEMRNAIAAFMANRKIDLAGSEGEPIRIRLASAAKALAGGTSTGKENDVFLKMAKDPTSITVTNLERYSQNLMKWADDVERAAAIRAGMERTTDKTDRQVTFQAGTGAK